MVATKYTYCISEDFPNQSMNLDSLKFSIQSSNITTALSYISSSKDDDICDIWFEDVLSSGDQSTLDSLIAAHTGDSLNCYRVWCSGCGKWFEVNSTSIPVECSECSCELCDVTDEQYALRGKYVATELPSGHHNFELSLSQGTKRWTRHKGYIQFGVKLESIPSSILYSDVIFDGAADLNTEEITKRGFTFSVIATGQREHFGITKVEFDWEAVE